jgi:glycosyltransferase involved in cell wall biosynthesis
MDYREYLKFDSKAFAVGISASGLAAAQAMRMAGRRRQALTVLAALHRSAFSPWASRAAEHAVQAAFATDATLFEDHVRDLQPTPATSRLFHEPHRLLGTRLLVLKSPGPRERGVLVFDYTPLFPLLPRLFHSDRILERYHLVLEPSWSGLCDLDLLCMLQYGKPIFVQVIEPYDQRFLDSCGDRVVPVPVAGNWWVDHRIIRPLPNTAKDIDVIMIAAWAGYKRHTRVFAALQTLRRRGTRLRVALIGYPNGLTKDHIFRFARDYGVDDQLELHEGLTPEQVNQQFARAHVNLVWSRREGVNRAIIEGLLADVPGILRRGFNYGYAYPFINEGTGCFADEHDLPDQLLALRERAPSLHPRDWVLEHWSVEKAVSLLDETLRRWSLDHGEVWTTGVVKKATYLNNQSYWDPADDARFAPDYEFLRQQIRTPVS